MANTQNLIPNSERTPQQLREQTRKAGIASGKARREKKAMKETLSALLSMPLNNGKIADIETIQSLGALEGKNITVQEAILFQQIKKALEGDTKAAEYVRDTSGNKLKEAVELSGGINNPFAGMSTEELRKLVGDD